MSERKAGPPSYRLSRALASVIVIYVTRAKAHVGPWADIVLVFIEL